MAAPYTFKNILDAAGAVVKMPFRQAGGTDLAHRPIHHSEVIVVQAEKTRPADTTAYTAGDAIGDGASAVFTFDVGILGVPAGLIVGARFARDVITDTGVRFRAEIHDAAPTTVPASDNAAGPILWANRATRRGWIDFAAPIVGEATGSNCLEYAGLLSNVQGIPFSATDGILRVLLTTRDAFTPAASKVSMVELDVVV